MQKRAFVVRCVILTLVTFLLARVYCAALPCQQYREKPDTDTFLLFGKGLAFADFDGDDRLDKAALTWAALNKAIEIQLSKTKTSTLLHFERLTSERGSLFTKDVDYDGDNDLIWTDLLHPQDVGIWLNDGTGQFERVCSAKYAKDFVLTCDPVHYYTVIPDHDSAFSPRRDRSPSSLSTHAIETAARAPIYRGESRRAPANACFLATPSDRGPPSRL